MYDKESNGNIRNKKFDNREKTDVFNGLIRRLAQLRKKSINMKRGQ